MSANKLRAVMRISRAKNVKLNAGAAAKFGFTALSSMYYNSINIR